ncbi:MAG TPA: hypothetical protein VFS20_26585 [Longimicrobium sp.]|nr:hypothetical protein [Longimicrobium sp.]
MLWLYDLPTPLLAALLLALSMAYALGTVLLVRKMKWQLSPEDNGTAAALHAFVGVMYAVALGLLVVNAQEDYNDVDHAVVNEANATGNLYRVLAGLEPPNRDRLQRDVQQYATLVLTDEWPRARHGGHSEPTFRAVDRLAAGIYTYQPATPREERVYPQMVGAVGMILEARQQRVYLGARGVGMVTWTIVILGGLITVGFSAFFWMQNGRAQVILTSLMAAVYGLMLTLLVSTDHPMWGNVAVDQEPFAQLRAEWMRLHQQGMGPPVPHAEPPRRRGRDGARPPPPPPKKMR